MFCRRPPSRLPSPLPPPPLLASKKASFGAGGGRGGAGSSFCFSRSRASRWIFRACPRLIKVSVVRCVGAPRVLCVLPAPARPRLRCAALPLRVLPLRCAASPRLLSPRAATCFAYPRTPLAYAAGGGVQAKRGSTLREKALRGIALRGSTLRGIALRCGGGVRSQAMATACILGQFYLRV